MQNDETKKTKSAHKDDTAPGRRISPRLGVILAVVTAVFVIAAFAAVFSMFRSRDQVDMSYFKIETAATDDARMQGLGGHAPLKSNEAMLFDFTDGANGKCFWMLDMTFPIDIAWLDSDKHVYKIVENVSPDTYPESFCANQNPAYVLELKSGRAKELGLQLGSQVKL